MSALASSSSSSSSSSPAARALAVAARIALVLGTTSSCALVLAFDHEVDVPRYGVRGTVSGLEQGRRLVLRINNGAPFERTENGAFAIPAALPDRTDYLATAETDAGIACDIDRPSGKVEGGDVAIAVECPSSNVTLTEVRIQGAVVEPMTADKNRLRATFAPPRAPLLTTGLATEVTAIVENPKATITIGGKPSVSGQPLPLVIGGDDRPLTVTIDVTTRTGAKASYLIEAVQRPTYVKAATQTSSTAFGQAVDVDGDTLAIGGNDASCARGIGGDANDTACPDAGAVHVFRRGAVDGVWRAEAYVKPSNTKAGFRFGSALALRGDMLVVGATGEPSSAIGINGDQNNTSTKDAGAVYVFRRSGTTWTQEAYIKRSVAVVDGRFGNNLACAGDDLVVSSAGTQVELFRRTGGTTWTASPTPLVVADSTRTLAIDGDTLVVGRRVFRRSAAGDNTWNLEATIPASGTTACFGCAVAIHLDTLVIGARDDRIGDGGFVGGAYVYRRSTTPAVTWSLEGSLRASNARGGARFGASVAIEGDSIAVGDNLESSGARGIDGDSADTSAKEAGAVYIFRRSASSNAWTQIRYVKAPNPFAGAAFGASVTLRSSHLVIGAPGEASSAVGIDGDQTNNSSRPNGAVYLW